jgi:hypothetical protein
MMNKEKISAEASIYLYHLNNANDENGMRKHESWKFSMVDEAGKKAIEREYNPTVSTPVKKTIIEDFSADVLLGISSSYPKILVTDKNIEHQKDASFFIAYATDRKIR